jgi:5-methylcytosine-specific restriction endonuclease McrA
MAEPFPKAKQLARGERRYRRKVASPKQWAAIRADKLDNQPCRIMLDDAPVAPAEELHHLVPRSLGGDDVADNLVGLCRKHHRWVTEREQPVLGALGESLTEAERAYVIGKLGPGAMGRLFGV